MKTLAEIIENLKISLYDDLFNRYLILVSAALFVADFLVWQYVIVRGEIFVYTAFGYYPLQLLSIIFILHLILSAYSYKKDKHVSNLLLGFLGFYTFLILIVEILYIIHQ